jgi:hypothetical protein
MLSLEAGSRTGCARTGAPSGRPSRAAYPSLSLLHYVGQLVPKQLAPR